MFILKSLINRIAYLIALCMIAACLQAAHARVINLPEEYASIQEAVEAAFSGDVIQINQHDTVDLLENDLSKNLLERFKGIVITNKDLTIIGTIPNERVRITQSGSVYYNDIYHYNGLIHHSGPYSCLSPMSGDNALVVDNSLVEIKNLTFYSPSIDCSHSDFSMAPIQVVSGKLTLDNVHITGIFKVRGDMEIKDSVIDSNSYRISYHPYRFLADKIAISAIYIYQNDSPDIRISDSEIIRDIAIGSRAITFEKILNAKVHIERSCIQSGYLTCGHITMSVCDRATEEDKGLAGILITDCSNVVFDMHGSATIGNSKPYPMVKKTRKKIPAGPGIEIMNSQDITIRGGECIGGDGASGQMGINIDENPQLPVDSGNGGYGIYATNSSIILSNVKAIGGQGGVGDPSKDIKPGEEGLPIFQDKNTTIVYDSMVNNWEIVQ